MPGYPTGRTPGSLLPYPSDSQALGRGTAASAPCHVADRAQLSAGHHPDIPRPVWLRCLGDSLLICEATPGQVASVCYCAKAVF